MPISSVYLVGDRQARVRHWEVSPPVLFVGDRVGPTVETLQSRGAQGGRASPFSPMSATLPGTVNTCGMQSRVPSVQ